MPTSPESERPSSSIVGRERVCAFWGGFLFFIAILKISPVAIENISLRVILKTRIACTVILVIVFVSFFIVPVPPVRQRGRSRQTFVVAHPTVLRHEGKRDDSFYTPYRSTLRENHERTKVHMVIVTYGFCELASRLFRCFLGRFAQESHKIVESEGKKRLRHPRQSLWLFRFSRAIPFF